ncbi:transporter substrate-binding domain-containing protein [Micromonospora sp. NBC_00389]|uniref:substrate-binding periplasmic protein n=1 Tax=Micromonospora sp. NBC_00389 TaxID=2903586 RepID=UPI002E230AAB
MSPHSRTLSALLKPLRNWGMVLVLSMAVVVSGAIVAVKLRSSPVSPSRPVLISSGAWAPFVGPELPDGGPVTKLVVEVLNRSGYSPEISYTSWSLAEEQVASGSAVGVFPLVSSGSRHANFLISDPLIDFEYVLFYDRRVGKPQISPAANLSALRVGRIAGYDYWHELESAVTDFVEFDSALDGFRALADGRIDLLAEGLLSGHAVLTDPSFAGDAGNFAYLQDGGPLVHSVQGLHFMMADTSAATSVMKEFNKELAKMRQGPAYEEIVSELEPSAVGDVTLTPSGKTGLVELLNADGKLVLLAPGGTRARVLTWPKEFVGSAGTPSENILVEVKVTNGPAKGRVLYVDARALQIEAEGR